MSVAGLMSKYPCGLSVEPTFSTFGAKVQYNQTRYNQQSGPGSARVYHKRSECAGKAADMTQCCAGEAGCSPAGAHSAAGHAGAELIQMYICLMNMYDC